MDVLIVDTNIVFSIAMNVEREMGRFLFYAHKYDVVFKAPNFLKTEIENHFPKLVALSGLTEEEVIRQLNYVYKRIEFVPDHEIPLVYFAQASPFVRDVDPDDVVFVALNDFLEAYLWTGDRALFRHLLSKGYQRVLNFEDLVEKYNLP